MMPLTLAKQGETVTIRKITGKDEIRQHLAELGFVVDGTVTVVSELGGNLIVQGQGQPHCSGQDYGQPGYDLRRGDRT